MDIQLNLGEDLDNLIHKLLSNLHYNIQKCYIQDFLNKKKEQNQTVDCLDELKAKLKNKILLQNQAYIFIELIQRILIIMKKTKQLQNIKWEDLLDLIISIIKKTDYQDLIYQKHHSLDSILYSIWSKFPKDKLEKIYLTQKNHIIFHLLTKFYHSKKNLPKYKEYIINRLKEEYLVDKSTKNIRITEYIEDIFDDKDIENDIIQNIIKIIKRSETNFDIFINCVENLNYDISRWAYSLIFEDFKQYLINKNVQLMSNIQKAILAIMIKTKQEKVIESIFDNMIKMIVATNNEYSRVLLLAVLFEYYNHPNKLKIDSLLAKILSSLINSVGMIQSDENEPYLNKIYACLENVQKTINYPMNLDEKDMIALKKSIINPNISKNSFMFLSIILNILIIANKDNKAKFNEYSNIVDTLYTTHVVPNLKNPIKLVASHSFVLTSWYLYAYYYNIQPNDKVNKNLKNDFGMLFDAENYLNMPKFFSKVARRDILSMFRLFALNTEIIENAVTLASPKGSIFANTIVELLISQHIKSNEVTEFFTTLKNPHFICQALTNGIFNKIYFIDDNEASMLKSDKMRTIIVHIAKSNVGIFEWEYEYLFKYIWCVFNTRINNKLKTIKEFQTLINDEENKTKFFEKLDENYEELRFYLLSKRGIFSANKNHSEVAISFYSFLILNGYDKLLDEFSLFLTSENFADTTEIEKFESDLGNYQSDLQNQINNPVDILIKLTALPAKVKPEETKEKEKPVANQAGKKGGKNVPIKKGGKEEQKPKQMILDQEELQKLRLEQLKAKMLCYLKPVCNILKKIISSRNIDIIHVYFEKCHELLLNLANEEEFRGPLEEVMFTLFNCSPYKEIQRSAVLLHEIYLNKTCHTTANSSKIDDEKLSETLHRLHGLDFQNIDSNYSIMIYNVCQYVLVKQDLDVRVKNPALANIIKIGKTVESDSIGKEILLMMIENLDVICNFEETKNLFIFLLEKHGENYYDEIYKYILNYMDASKKICLESFLTLESQQILNSFDKYNKIKIIKMDENEEIVSLASKVMDKYPYEPTEDDVENFDFYDFISTQNKDSVEKFCKNTTSYMTEIIKGNSNNIFFEKMFQTAKDLSEQEDIDDIDDIEEVLGFLPYFLENNIKLISEKHLKDIFDIFLNNFCVEKYSNLLEKAMETGIHIIKEHGPQRGDAILSILDPNLDEKEKAQKKVSAIVLMGACAQFSKNKNRVKPICDKILNFAATSTESLQKSLAKCLPELIVFFDNPIKIAEDLLGKLSTETNITAIRGTCYLLAGFVKGLGIKYLEKMKILDFIEENMEGKKNISVSRKLATILLIQALAENLGKTFEPYVIRILTVLKQFFGEQNEETRSSSLKATKIIMSNLSAYGVKLILPLLLQGVDDKAWRAKVANISVLGNMAFCAPKQLSTCLPQIVPKLAQALSDTHPTVKEKANQALNDIGSTIKNPEISDVVDILIMALSNPFEQNIKGLEVLLKTQFVHYIDAPALSLIIPIIEYGLRNRDSIPKKNASHIVGSISDVIKNPKDLLPYLDILLNALKTAIADTMADVREVAAKAFGSLTKRLGIENAAIPINLLKSILENQTSTSVEKAGAAQSMAEITYALGSDHIKQVLPVFLNETRSKENHIRESYIGIFAFLPSIMGESFEIYIDTVVESIMDAISDDNENIRSLTLRVFKILIKSFGLKKTNTLMETAERGLFSTNWRKRSSSCVLMNEMLLALQKTEKLEKKEKHHQGEMDYLDRYNKIITSIYILKFDNIEDIRIQANQIWKNFVENTPRTLKNILPYILMKLLELLADIEDGEYVVKNCLSEFSAKYSETLFREIIDFIMKQKASNANHPNIIRALSLLFNDVIIPMDDFFIEKNREQILNYLLDLIITDDKMVRESSCILLKTLIYKCKSVQLFDQLVPKIFNELENLTEDSPNYDNYLKFFDAIIELGITDKLDHIGEHLLSLPLTQYKLDILTNNSETFGPLLYQDTFLEHGFKELFHELLSNKYNENITISILYCIKRLSISIDIAKLGNFLTNCYDYIATTNLKNDVTKIYYGLETLDFFFQKANQDYFEHIDLTINHISLYFASNNERILQLVSSIMKSILNSLKNEEYFDIIKIVNKYFDDSLKLNKKSDPYYLNIFCLDHGLDPFINMMVQCLVYGPVEVFEEALTTYDYILEHTKKNILEYYSLKLVGPLIRVVLYKCDTELKLKVIKNILKFDEREINLNIFLPQLQTTFFRLINDYHDEQDYLKGVACGLSLIIKYSIKKDYIYNELFNKYLNETVKERKFAYIYCLYYITKKHHDIISKALLDVVLEKFFNFSDLNPNDKRIKYISRMIGIIASKDNKNRQKDLIKKIISRIVKISDDNFYIFSHLIYLLKYCDNQALKEEIKQEDLSNILSNFLKAIQLRHNIQLSLKMIRKVIEKNEKDFVCQIMKKLNIPGLIGDAIQDEYVTSELSELMSLLK